MPTFNPSTEDKRQAARRAQEESKRVQDKGVGNGTDWEELSDWLIDEAAYELEQKPRTK